jgi:hypothetical protein
MINLPYEKIIEKIIETAGLSESEINSKIDDKLNQLSGLISKEGAAHILANELGVKLFEVPKNLKIKDVLEGMRSIDISGKVQKVYDVRAFETDKGQGKVGSFILADETGHIRITCWHNKADELEKLVEDLTVKIVGGYVRMNNGRKEIHLNDRSKIVHNPKGVEVGEVKKFVSTRKKLSEISESDESVEIFATIVQVFDPRFFEVCPECSKRARQRDDGFFCEVHNKVNPDYSYVLNLLLDDGSETTRTIFFGRQLENLLGKDKNDVLEYRENPAEFDMIKTDLLGKTIKVIGRVKKNDMFDRLELMANLVFTDVNPAEEINRLKKSDASLDTCPNSSDGSDVQSSDSTNISSISDSSKTEGYVKESVKTSVEGPIDGQEDVIEKTPISSSDVSGETAVEGKKPISDLSSASDNVDDSSKIDVDNKEFVKESEESVKESVKEPIKLDEIKDIALNRK